MIKIVCEYYSFKREEIQFFVSNNVAIKINTCVILIKLFSKFTIIQKIFNCIIDLGFCFAYVLNLCVR